MQALRWFIRRFDWARTIALGLLVFLVALRIWDHEFIQSFRFQAFDLYQQAQPREKGNYPVTIIDVDDRSIEEIGQWPWPRTVIADLIDKATAAGPAAIAFDIVFADPDRLSPEVIAQDNEELPEDIRAALSALPNSDGVLAEAMARSRVVLGETSVRNATEGLVNRAEVPKVEYAFLGPDPTPYLMKFPDLVQNLPQIDARAAGRGIFTVRPESDGVFRRIPLVLSVQDQIRLGLSIELLRVATGGGAFAIKSNAAGIEGIVVARQLIETGPNGRVWPYFSPSSRDRYVSAADVLMDRLPPERLRGQLILVGTSAIGLEDFRATPLGVPMAGVEIHAQVLENVMAGTMLKRPSQLFGVELASIALMGLAMIALMPLLGASLTLVATIVLAGGFVGTSYYLFDAQGKLLDPTFPTFTVVLIAIFMSTINYLREERQRRQIRGAFGQYVSPDLVNQLQEDPDRLILGGERRPLSILFSDVRGFTTISESFKDNPAGLTELMNRFLTVLSNAILHHGGTIDKFMGDAVMAFWNAPLDHEDHVRSSCRAALKMMVDVEELNARRAAEAAEGEFVHRIDVGIGINTGDCVVGNMGSDTRFDYTALGDAVNLASRLEGQSKTYGVDIILGSATAEPVADDFAVMELDLIRVKGKTEPAQVFGLFGDERVAETEAFKTLASENAAMLKAYRGRDWQSAADHLEEAGQAAKAAGIALDGYLALYRERLAEMAIHPVGPDWDGVFTATSK
ncbi:MAG: adenylate/guanylate cyclase domain-containing protein [Sulfitobacter sp.]|nr:adenylate/guanylate cyclase domain-containing protein [Sulfitobacter sp.]